jgi:hypothetical protein
MSWTTPAGVRSQVQKLWERGIVLAALAAGEELFPRRLLLKGPTSKELTERFAEVRDWIAEIKGAAKFYRIEWRQVNHRILGANSLPEEIWIDSLADALGLIGKSREAEKFAALLELIRERQPELLPWLTRKPLRALNLADAWPRLLEIVIWLRKYPRPALYLRQVDLPGVHSKFIEEHRSVLAELFDLVLSTDGIDLTAGVNAFCRRYGFRDKPLRLRFRLLDPSLALLPTGTDQDLTVTGDTFARLDLPVRRVFITENEINFLAFPQVEKSLVIFGAGYGFASLAAAKWLQSRQIHYWGDLDTHGFAILDQLRAHFPDATSFLMDRETLLAHRLHWGNEPQPESRDLPRLNHEEKALYDDLRWNRLGDHLRLEQERIGFVWVVEALNNYMR